MEDIPRRLKHKRSLTDLETVMAGIAFGCTNSQLATIARWSSSKVSRIRAQLMTDVGATNMAGVLVRVINEGRLDLTRQWQLIFPTAMVERYRRVAAALEATPLTTSERAYLTQSVPDYPLGVTPKWRAIAPPAKAMAIMQRVGLAPTDDCDPFILVVTAAAQLGQLDWRKLGTSVRRPIITEATFPGGVKVTIQAPYGVETNGVIMINGHSLPLGRG